mmetsp:Transcript_41624/g.67233  ORF Transcript_41624/g.67233 Transcript_41624/m.67233 type:complete len:215 (-) Transcript_41624:224-868(-)
MAYVHMHKLLAALLWFPTASGVYSGFITYFSSCFKILTGMLSLSNPLSFSRNLLSPNTFFAVSQSGFSPRSTLTASIVIITSGGGFAKDLISWISFLSSESSDLSALSSAGMAMSRSFCASAAITATSSACFRTMISSPATFSLMTSAFFCSSLTTGTSSSASLIFSAMKGASFVSSSCKLVTTLLASSILSTPVCKRFRFWSISSRFSPIISK